MQGELRTQRKIQEKCLRGGESREKGAKFYCKYQGRLHAKDGAWSTSVGLGMNVKEKHKGQERERRGITHTTLVLGREVGDAWCLAAS